LRSLTSKTLLTSLLLELERELLAFRHRASPIQEKRRRLNSARTRSGGTPGTNSRTNAKTSEADISPFLSRSESQAAPIALSIAPSLPFRPIRTVAAAAARSPTL